MKCLLAFINCILNLGLPLQLMVLSKRPPPIQINFNNHIIKSKPSMGILGIIFYSKLQWQPQIQNAINKIKKRTSCNITHQKILQQFSNCSIWSRLVIIQSNTSGYYSHLALYPRLQNPSNESQWIMTEWCLMIVFITLIK